MKAEEAREADHYRYEEGEWWYYPPSGVRARAATGICEWCGEKWVRNNTPSRANRFCGNECYRTCRRERRIGECERCGQEFVRTEYPRGNQDGRKGGGQKYCSHECYAKSNTGENHWNFNGYVTEDRGYIFYSMSHPEYPGQPVHWIKWNRENPDGSCNRCGDEVEHVHHRDGDRSNNDLDNLEGLCAPCHMKHHATEPGHT